MTACPASRPRARHTRRPQCESPGWRRHEATVLMPRAPLFAHIVDEGDDLGVRLGVDLSLQQFAVLPIMLPGGTWPLRGCQQPDQAELSPLTERVGAHHLADPRCCRSEV